MVYIIFPDGANPVDIQSRSKGISTGYTVTSKPQQSHFPMRSSKQIQFTPTRSHGQCCACFTRCLLLSATSPAHLSVFSDSHPAQLQQGVYQAAPDCHQNELARTPLKFPDVLSTKPSFCSRVFGQDQYQTATVGVREDHREPNDLWPPSQAHVSLDQGERVWGSERRDEKQQKERTGSGNV